MQKGKTDFADSSKRLIQIRKSLLAFHSAIFRRHSSHQQFYQGINILWMEAHLHGSIWKNMDIYKGALYENVVGEALTKCGYELYYYKKG